VATLPPAAFHEAILRSIEHPLNPKVVSSRGFANLELVNESVRELYRRLSPSGVRLFEHDFVLRGRAIDPKCDSVIRTQKIAHQLAYHFRLTVSAVVVTFRSNLPVPGRIELSSSLDFFFIDLHSEHRDNWKAIVAILAHEVAHIFLHHAGIRFDPEFHNEVLTDTTAAYLGCGASIFNGASETITHLGTLTQHQSRQFGYITVDEFGYIQAKRDLLYGRDSSASVDRGLPSSGLRAGRKRLQMERRRRPYASKARAFISQLFSACPHNQTITNGKITFPCACCAQSIRIPIVSKKLAVRCPRCESTLFCQT
jgi:hypothetical protein